jgi:pyruvate kinase
MSAKATDDSSEEDVRLLLAADASKLTFDKVSRVATSWDLKKTATDDEEKSALVRKMKYKTQLEHNQNLDIYVESKATRKSGIICTIGPASQSVDMLGELMDAGMNVVRMNFSHGTYAYHLQTMKNARAAAELRGLDICIALDTKGPEIRTGNFVDGAEVYLESGAKVRLTTDEDKLELGTAEEFYVDYKNITKVMKVGGVVFIDDGLVSVRVDAIAEDHLDCTVVNSGPVSNHKGVNLPNVLVDLPPLSDKDKKDLTFGLDNGVDMIFASFVRKPEDVQLIRDFLLSVDPKAGKRMKIVSKIENHEGVQKFDDILKLTDGVMVARGDLGIEIPPEKVFVAQKMMITKCNLSGKPVIVATQMLESMVKNPRPTRAEASDVANAVLDGTDCVMLSGETAKGKYPLEAVTIMARICREAESVRSMYRFQTELREALPSPLPTQDIIAGAAVQSCTEQSARLLIVITNSGDTARLVAKYRPPCPIVAIVGASHAYAARQLAISHGVYAITYDDTDGKKSSNARIKIGMEYAKSRRWIVAGTGDLVVAVHADKMGTGFANLVRIVPVL